MKTLSLFALLMCLSIGVVAKTYESEGMKFKLEVVKKGLEVPWGFDFIDKDTMIFTEREGRISILDMKSGKVTVLRGTPQVVNKFQGGMLDVVLHPEYAKNKRIFFSYSKKVKDRMKDVFTTAIATGVVVGEELQQFKDLFVGNIPTSRDKHFGSRIVYDRGHLFFTMGDRGDRENAQDLSSHAGKLLRIKEDGSIPKDNPFVNKKGAAPEVWSYGHRNPQGLVLVGDQLWEQEHGPRGGDEINLIVKGGNYGWPVVTYGKEYWGPSIGEGTHKKGMEQPKKFFVPSIAPCGLAWYDGKRYPVWKSSLLSTALKIDHLNIARVSGDKIVGEIRVLEDLDTRFRNVRVSPDDYIYLSTDEGYIYRIKPL